MKKTDELLNLKSCWNRASPTTLVFVLLDWDEATPATIRFWCFERVRRGLNAWTDPQITEATLLANDIEASMTRVRSERRKSKGAVAPSADLDKAEYEALARGHVAAILERGDLDAVRAVIGIARDYHDNQESGADAMGVEGSVAYHQQRGAELEAMLRVPRTA